MSEKQQEKLSRETIASYVEKDIAIAISLFNTIRSDKAVFDALTERMYASYEAHFQNQNQEDNG